MVRTELLPPNRHDTGSTSPRSVGEVALIRDTTSHDSPALIAPFVNLGRRRDGAEIFFGTGHCSRGFRALALFERRPPERVVRSLLPASENLHRAQKRTKPELFDYLIGTKHQAGRDFVADCPSRVEVDDQLEASRLLHGKISGAGTTQHLR